MHIVMTSDFHGRLPTIPACDLLLIGGDVCPDFSINRQAHWLNTRFRTWLEAVPAKDIVGIAGNHDFVFETDRVPDLPWHYLLDETVEIGGFRIYGTPWVPNLKNWAFHGGMKNSCGDHFDQIPDDTDIILSHGPMQGYGDYVESGGHVGSLEMAGKVTSVTPRLLVCGHIHEGFGHYRHPAIEQGVYNVSYLNERYEAVHDPIELVLN